MLFLDFLCFFFCIVLLNAHPISKRNSHNISELVEKLDNGHIIQSYSADQLLKHQYTTWKEQKFAKQDVNIDGTYDLGFSKIPEKTMKFKRITTKVMDLSGFERLENFGKQKYPQNSLTTYKTKEKEIEAAKYLKENTDSHLKPVSSFFEDKHVFYNDVSIEPTIDDSEFSGTAEIEAILNEIKQREIQMIADQIPSVSNLVTNTVTETTFASMPSIRDSSIYPDFVFSTFLLVDNKSLLNFDNYPHSSYILNSKLHNIALRSIKEDSSTLANDVENMLQNKIKKVYRKIKNKISKDLNKEIKKTKATVKEQITKINKKISNASSKNCTLQKATTKLIPKLNKTSKPAESRNSRNTLFNPRKTKQKLTTLTTHTIPTVGDDLSMLSIVEQLLEKSEEDNAINILTTKNNYSAKKYKDKLFKRNSLQNNLIQSNRKLLNNDEYLIDLEYTHSDNSIHNDTDATTEDTSFEGLSNKLSYNDYVNGYKYYLNFQRDKEDQKYSYQVRYQAHKHHNVDDIGKFILNKIPQLPTTRLRRGFVDSETYDVQEVSTKSEDSWFKKHFFMFMDSNSPKKFHTSQTVSLKPSGIQTNSIFFSNNTTKQTYGNNNFKNVIPRRFKKSIDKIKMIRTKTDSDEPRYCMKAETGRNRISKKLKKRSNLENHYKQKSDILSSINYKKNGFVDLDLVNKPTAIIKLKNKNKKTNKIRNIFHKLRFGHNKHKKKEKRQSQNRFNFFKGIKNIFKEKNEEEKDFKATKGYKIFDYEVMTTNTNAIESYEEPKFKKLLKIDELRQQIPNISADFSTNPTFYSGGYFNLTGFESLNPGQRNEKFIKKPALDDDRRSFSILTGSQYLQSHQKPLAYPFFNANHQKDLKIDDIINVNIKSSTNDVVYPEKSNTVPYPSLMSMSKSVITNEVDDLKMRLLNTDLNQKKQKMWSTDTKKGYNNDNNLNLLNTYSSSPLKDFQMEQFLLNDVEQNNQIKFKKPVTISGPVNRINLFKKSTRNNKPFFFINSNYSLAPISSLRLLNDKNGQIITKSYSQDIALKKFYFQPTPFVDPTMFAYRKCFNNLSLPYKKNVLKKIKLRPNYIEDPSMFAYKKTSSLTKPEKELVASYDNNIDITVKRPFTKVNTPPEQYYSTPLPMQMDDFYKFLKDENIDVDSVTAPIFDSVPKRIDTWNLYKNNVSQFSNKQVKQISKNEHSKTFNYSHKAGGQSKNNHSHAHVNSAKKNPVKPRLETQKGLSIGIDHNRTNIQEPADLPEYETSNYLSRKQKHIKKLRKKSNLMSNLNLGSMDLFQLNNSPKKSVVNSQQEEKGVDVTVIDLEPKKTDSNSCKGLFSTNYKKMNTYEQLRTKTKLSNIDTSHSTFMIPNRDPLRFTHMYNDHIVPKQSNSPLYNYMHKKSTLLPTQPRRVQISGHSYKYDIIYQKPNYDWMSDLYEVNPTLLTNDILNYKNYPTTIKRDKGSGQWYFPGNDNVHKNNDLRTFPSIKIKKEIYDFDQTSPKDISIEVENILLPKKEHEVAKVKNKAKFFFSSKEVNDIDDEVYFEPFIRHKSDKKKSQNKVSNNKKKFDKREIQGQDSFTAKDVAALEIVVDLMKSTESYDEKGFRNAFFDIDAQKNIPYIIPSLKSQNHATNTIQVHIALPSNVNEKKRSLEPIKVRKIFSAVMSSPVDLEYQIHSFEDNKVTRAPQDVISPGLYLLVENTNATIPKGNFALKPIRSHIGISNLILPKSSDSMSHSKNNMSNSINDHMSKVTLNSNIIAAVNNQLVQLYENMANLNETKHKRFIKEKKIKRNINLESVKKYFGHDRVCNCRCKINETMCKPCAASDAVITELIFEFDNLAKYMTDHCTEIQTFFWMNPTGGKKLKDSVHRLDIILNNYYKRVKGKCQGRTCKMISSSIDKREYKIHSSIIQFLNDLETLADYLNEVVQNSIVCDVNILNAGKKCVATINKCIEKNVNKRSYASIPDDLNNKSVYSLNNIRVNLICNKDLTKHANYLTKNTIGEVLFEKNTHIPMYYDEDEIKKGKKKGKGIKELLKMYSNKIKFKKVGAPQFDLKNNKKVEKKHKKRHSVSYNQIEAPFLADSGGTFWYKYLHDKMREPRQQKYVSNKNTQKVSNKILKFSNINLSTTKITRNEKNTNIFTLNNNSLLEKANETDETFLNIDTLNHNLNDLFKLLGNIDTVHGNKTKIPKLPTPSIKQSSTEIHTSIKTSSTLTTTKKTARPSNQSTFEKDHSNFDTSENRQNTKKGPGKELKATKNVLRISVTPKILHNLTSKIANSKIGLFNRIVSGSLKLLGSNDNKNTTLIENEISSVENRATIEYVKKYRKKFGVSTEKYSQTQNYNDGIDNNDNFTTLTEPTIIIIDNIGFSDKFTVSMNNKNMIKSFLKEYRTPDFLKRNSFKILREKNCGESPEDDMNDIGLNSISNRVKLKNTTQKHSQPTNCEYFDYDIIHSIRKSLGLTESNLTTPRERKGALNRFMDKFSIKIIPNDKKNEPDNIPVKQNTNSTSKVVPKVSGLQNLNMSVDKKISDITIESSSKKSSTTTTAETANTTQNKSNKETTKLTTGNKTHIQSNSGNSNHTTKQIKEAGEDKLNHICDISSTIAYLSKLQKSMLKNQFEQYVKDIPCYEYNDSPQQFIIRSCIRKPSKTYSKRRRKSKTIDYKNRKRINKWVWIRDKRSIIKDDSRVEDEKGKHFKDLKKNCLSGCSVPFIVTNCVNVDKDYGNEEENFHKDMNQIFQITDDYNSKRKHIKENLAIIKKNNIINNIGIKKRNLLSFSYFIPRRRGCKNNFNLNGNSIQLWLGENDYYENFVRGKDGIYKKSLKRRKRLDVDMSELNDELLNLPPLDPFTDEIYVMVENSISFDCHTPGLPKSHHDYIWTSDRHGILEFDNVLIEGSKVIISQIQPKNFGNYLCTVENAIIKSIKITIIDLPNINIVLTPVYETDTCVYDDLKILQKLNEPMSQFTSKYNCSVRIDEPICLKNSVDGIALMRPIIVMSLKRQTNIKCSAECLRDLHCSLTLLHAKNAAALALGKVLIFYNGTKRILSPLRERKRSFVTHTLKRKDTNGHQEYHSLAADMDPNRVNVVLLCSAGFYLVVGQKICAVCPPNTFSLEGENVCSNCPRGARSEPGARSCHLSLDLRKNKCPWKYVCGGAVCMLSCVIASCYAVSCLLKQPVSTEEIKTCRKTRKVPRKETHQKESKNRPLSPSRVILSRLLRGSLSSSQATNSQETRFALWKEKNTLPPLPPIDFEL